MKTVKQVYGINRIVDTIMKEMSKSIPLSTTNNWRKMHGIPKRRNHGRK